LVLCILHKLVAQSTRWNDCVQHYRKHCNLGCCKLDHLDKKFSIFTSHYEKQNILSITITITGDFARTNARNPRIKSSLFQGCQVVYFHTKNHNLGIFGWAWEWKILVYVMPILIILLPFGIFYGHWYIFPVLVFGPRKIWHPWSFQWIAYICNF
jgi:hypothetical protein